MTTPAANPYRLLPSVEDALRTDGVRVLLDRVPRELLVEFVQEVVDGLRDEVRGGLTADELASRLESGELVRAVERLVEREARSGIVRAVNGTGVVLHTGLGRSAVHPEVAERMAEMARSYCVLEISRDDAQRTRRDDRLSELVARATGAEAAIAVNNNAAAVLLALSGFAAGRETILSRGELVEIGGSFRMPDVMERANTRLVEVGTTNRTRIEDYRRALGPDTGLLLKVHTSNFRVVGFTEEVSAAELGELGRESGVPSVYDLGSGLFEALGATSLPDLGDEPPVRETVQSGIDVVTTSGDKLLGGPQAGILMGRKTAIEALRKCPLYRALRLDKVAIAGLEATFELLLAGRGDELPVRAMLNAETEELCRRAKQLAATIDALPAFEARVVDAASRPGSGSAPDVELATVAVRIDHERYSADALGRRLRAGHPPVFARIQEDGLYVDPRTLLEGDEQALVGALSRIV